MPIVFHFSKKDNIVVRYKAKVTPIDTVESIKKLLKMPRLECFYRGSQLALKDTMEFARITSVAALNVPGCEQAEVWRWLSGD
jgi:hypothetical protein